MLTFANKAAMKRAFERKNGVLSDRYIGDSGRPVQHQLPASMVGEALDGELQEKLVSDAKAGVTRALYALTRDANLSTADVLLEGVRNGGDPTLQLLAHLKDPRVRPAIIEAGRRETHQLPGNVFQVLGLIGGADARNILNEKFDQLCGDSRLFDDHEHVNSDACEAVAIGQSLLKLDRDHIRAATLIADVLERHPTGFNRRDAAWRGADAYAPLPTEAMELLRAALDRALEADDELLMSIAKHYLGEDPRRTVERIAGRLSSKAAAEQSSAIRALLEVPPPFASIALGHVVAWTERTDDLRLALRCVGTLRSLVSDERAAAVFKAALEDESPSLRWYVIRLLKPNYPPHLALAQNAMLDEPDPALRNMLVRYCSGESGEKE